MNRDKLGRFSSGAIGWLKVALKRSAIVCALGWLVFGSVQYGKFEQGRTLVAEAASVPLTSFDIKGKTVDELQDELIEELAHKENEGGVPCYPDDNSRGTLSKKDKVSCGDLSYKVSTVQRHAKGCFGEVLNDEEAVLRALDDEKARVLAKCAIFGKQNAINEWMGATEKMKVKVQVIREMI